MPPVLERIHSGNQSVANFEFVLTHFEFVSDPHSLPFWQATDFEFCLDVRIEAAPVRALFWKHGSSHILSPGSCSEVPIRIHNLPGACSFEVMAQEELPN